VTPTGSFLVLLEQVAELLQRITLSPGRGTSRDSKYGRSSLADKE
jgi:hypothetical protein